MRMAPRAGRFLAGGPALIEAHRSAAVGLVVVGATTSRYGCGAPASALGSGAFTIPSSQVKDEPLLNGASSVLY